MQIAPAPDVKARVEKILPHLEMPHVDLTRVICMRSRGSKARAYARVWAFPKMWQRALSLKAHYVIEVLEQHFDKQNEEEKDKIIIHELCHIPKTFSGGLRPHAFFGKKIDKKAVEKLYAMYKAKE